MADENDKINIKVLIDTANSSKDVTVLKDIIEKINVAQKKVGESSANFKKLGDAAKVASDKIKQTGEHTSNLKGHLMEMGPLLAEAFGAEKILEFGKEIFKVTAEFQKMEATLTKALGSKSTALVALEMIEKIAADSPFSVKQMTDAYATLATKGIEPTKEEMLKMGDLAASQNKSIDELASSLVSATQGKVNALRDFGIAGKKHGNDIIYTFKGVRTEVKNNAKAIEEYVLGLGDLSSVSGSAKLQTETLGGSVTKLKNNFDVMYKTLGEGSAGPMADMIASFSEALGKANEVHGAINKLNKTLGESGNKISYWERFKGADAALFPLQKALNNITEISSEFKKTKEFDKSFDLLKKGVKKLNEEFVSGKKDLKEYTRSMKLLEEEGKVLQEMSAHLVVKEKAAADAKKLADEDAAKDASEAAKKAAEARKKILEEKLKNVETNNKLLTIRTQDDTQEKVDIEKTGLDKISKFYTENYKGLGLTLDEFNLKIEENNKEKLKLQTEFDKKQKEKEDKVKEEKKKALEKLKKESEEEYKKELITQKNELKQVQENEQEKLAIIAANKEKENKLLFGGNLAEAVEDEKELLEAKIEALKKTAEVEVAQQTKTNNILLQGDLESLNEKKDAAIENAKGNSEEILAIETQFEDDKQKLINDYSEENNKIKTSADKTYNQKKIALETELNIKIKSLKEEHLKQAAELEQQAFEGANALSELGATMRESGLKKGSKEEEDAARKSFQINKELQLGQTIVTGIQNGISAFGAGVKMGGPILGGIYAGISAIGSLAAIAKIKSTQFKSSSSPSESNSSSNITSKQTNTTQNPSQNNSSFIPPGLQRVGGGLPGINVSQNNQSSNGEQQPLQAYVITQDITNAQDKASIIKRRTQF